jgi:H+/gluconate symporter-like permease
VNAAAAGIDPALMHRVAAIGCGGLSGLPHNGAALTLLAICGATHRGSYRDIGMVMVVGTILALLVIITLGKLIGSFRKHPGRQRRWV